MADQLVKGFLRVTDPSVALIPGFFQIRVTTNTGAAFGLLSDFPVLVVLISLVVIAVLGYIFVKEGGSPLLDTSLALIIGGAVSNLIDRFVFGAVLDFIAFSFWPSFNIADACICVGAGLLILDTFWKRKG